MVAFCQFHLSTKRALTRAQIPMNKNFALVSTGKIVLPHLALADIYTFYQASLEAQLVKNPPAMRETWVQSWVRKIPWRREWLLNSVFLPGEFHEQRSLAVDSPWGRKGVGHGWVTNTHIPSTWFTFSHHSSLLGPLSGVLMTSKIKPKELKAWGESVFVETTKMEGEKKRERIQTKEACLEWCMFLCICAGTGARIVEVYNFARVFWDHDDLQVF